MSPITRSSFGRLTSGMRQVSRNPGHFHTGRWCLLGEGVLLIALGVAGFVSTTTHPDAGPAGAPVLVLALTPWHSGLLLAFGLLAVVGTLERRAAIAVTTFGTLMFLVLVFVGAVAAVHHAPGPLGLDTPDIVLHGVLAAANFAILYWLIPDVLEGPDWVRKRNPLPAAHDVASAGSGAGTRVPTTGDTTTGIARLIATAHELDNPRELSNPQEPQPKGLEMHTPQTVVITGASAGIGRAAARAFADRGDRVALLARGSGGLDAAVKDVEAAGGKALAISTDVADYAQVDAAAAQVEEAFGHIDVWVNVAFTSVFAPFDEISADEYRRVTEVSYLGYVHGTMVALSRMRPRDAGTIVQVGSALGTRAIPLQSAYCGAKHAINGFTESVRTELMHDNSNIHITVAQMPAVNTPQFSWVLSRLPNHPQPVPPIYQPEIAARAVLYAAEHPKRKQYWVGASTALTTLGQKVAPALLDRYLAKTGYNSQQTDERVSPNQPNNLWEPRDDATGGDHGAHGVFDKRAINVSPQMWMSQHVGTTTIAAAAAGSVALTAIVSRLRHA